MLFLIAISNTIKYLHKKNIAHGNIKPNNILFDNNLKAVVSDWDYERENKQIDECNVTED